MGSILGMASTHWPLLIPPDEGRPWPFQMVMERWSSSTKNHIAS